MDTKGTLGIKAGRLALFYHDVLMLLIARRNTALYTTLFFTLFWLDFQSI